MTRQQLERHQVWAYLVMILAGLGLGSAVPELAPTHGGGLPAYQEQFRQQQ